MRRNHKVRDYMNARQVRAVLTTFLAAAALQLSAGMAAAEDAKGRLWITGDVENSFEGDFLFSRRTAKRSSDVYIEVNPTLTFHLLPGLTAVWETVFEPVTSVAPGETRVFGDMGLFSRQLYLSYEHSLGGIGPARLVARAFGGKFTLAYGRAWDVAPGIYGNLFAEDGYEYEERVGFGGALAVDGGVLGKQVLQASVFFLDTSALSNSVITPRGRTRLSDGGVSNTGRLNSFALSWTATRLPALPGAELQLAMIYQSPGTDGTVAEIGVVGSALYKWKLGDVTVTPFVELAHYTGADGTDGKRRLFLTASVEAAWRGWNASVAAMVRNTYSNVDLDVHDVAVTVNAGYTFKFGLGLNVAYLYVNQDRVSRHGVGFLLTYNCRFALASKSATVNCRGG